MTSVPVLPQRVLTIHLDVPLTDDRRDYIVADLVRRMVRHRLVPALTSAGYTVPTEERVFTALMIRLVPQDSSPCPVLEVTFPHPGGTGTLDPMEWTPTWDGHAELIGGPEDGLLVQMANTWAENLTRPDPTATTVWDEDPTPQTTTTNHLTYTRTGYDLDTGHWLYTITTGGHHGPAPQT